MTLWEGRLGSDQARALMELSESLSFDRRLAPDDLRASRAHVRGLERGGIITSDETAEIIQALDQVERELGEGSFAFAEGDEDIHTAVERRVSEIAPVTGAKLHTGRSRNDQVATDLRLFTRRELSSVAGLVIDLSEALLVQAQKAGGAYLPGYTHLQRAQCVLLSHHLLAHGWALSRDVDRIIHTVVRLNVSPLGAGALAGSSLPLDPEGVACELGFESCFENSMDAVGDRDFVAEALFDLALLGVHLSRFAEEIVIWSTQEVGFISIADAYATGSSMLPQKKNPDIAELVRGKAGRLIGDLTGFLATLKGLPLAYNRDLQEDKDPLFDSLDNMRRELVALKGLIETATFQLDRMRDAAHDEGSAATDLAELLVSNGVPFREAHRVVGSLVRQAAAQGRSLFPEVFAELVSAHPLLGPEALQLLDPGVGVTRRTSPGAAGPVAVARQMERFRERLDVDRNRLETLAALDVEVGACGGSGRG